MNRGLWVRIHYASILFWNRLTTTAVEIINYLGFTKKRSAESPRFATSTSKSRRRPSDSRFAFPFPTLRVRSRHSVEFEASQERLRHSIRLQRMGPRAPKRCDTPLLPLHSVPGFGKDDGDQGRANRTMYPTAGDVSPSPSSTASFPLNTPLSNSNSLRNTDPFLYQRESFYSPSEHGDILIGIRDSLDFTGRDYFMDLEKPTRAHLGDSPEDNGRTGRRRFCACRQPCSDFAPVSPVADSPALDSKRISSPIVQRRHSFDVDPFADPASRTRNVVESPLLSSLDLAAGVRPMSGWNAKLWVSKHVAETVIPSPSLSFRRSDSDIYDAWLSSWCFRPVVPARSAHLPVPDIVVSPAPPSSSFFPPCGTDSPALESRYRLAPGLASRDSRIVSGIHKLQNLRELLVLLDETVAATQRDLSLEGSGELSREDVEVSRRLGYDRSGIAAGQAL